MSYVFNPKEGQVAFYNVENVVEEDPQSWMPFDFSGRDKIHVTILIGDGVGCLYVNDELALTARMYHSLGTDWEIFGINAGVTWENIAVYD
jgi:beta-fructofuranosidase